MKLLIIAIVFTVSLLFDPAAIQAQTGTYRQYADETIDPHNVRYTTSFAYRGDHRNRANNIRLAASRLSHVQILPGQTVSFNHLVGPRTHSNGYRMAPTIISRELQDGMGGGVCQVAGTLHAAALFAGLDIVERTFHSRASAYLPPGLDATVYYGYIDLKIRNPFSYPVVIEMFEQYPGKLTAEIILHPTHHQSLISVSTLQTWNARTVRIRDVSLPSGVSVVDQRGRRGGTYVLFRHHIQPQRPVEQTHLMYNAVPTIIRFN